jgi:hypothetical protein
MARASGYRSRLTNLAFLVLLPAVLAAIPAWLFYEVTIANMGSPSDDRSTRLRIWFLVAMPLLSATVALLCFVVGTPESVYTGSGFIWAFGCFGAFLFVGEPLGPSPRVLSHWQRERSSALRRSLGPGVLRAAALLLALTALGLAGNAVVGLLSAKTAADRAALIAFHGYALAFFGFVVGFTAWARSRASSAGTPRVLLVVVLFFASVGPWIAMAIAGLIATEHDHAILMAGPSPTFAVTMAESLSTNAPDHGLIAITGCACAAAWALIGTGLFAAAGLRVKKRLQAEQASLDAMQRAFDDEDAAQQASLTTADPQPQDA